MHLKDLLYILNCRQNNYNIKQDVMSDYLLTEQHRIKQNDIIATSGFGAGLSWGAALIKWG